MSSRRLPLALCLAAAVGVACSSGGTDRDADPIPPAIAAIHPQMAVVWPETPEYQKALLRDGILTYDEYEAAALATVQCIRDAGFDILGDIAYDEESDQFTYRIAGDVAPGPTPPPAVIAMYECEAEYQGVLTMAWVTMMQPSEAERQEARNAFRECLREHGLNDEPPFGTPAFPDWMLGDQSATKADCQVEVTDRLGVAPF